jgi:lipopolysaccharide/colanic/teichoic acid biosynthesis glycosyltransferase
MTEHSVIALPTSARDIVSFPRRSLLARLLGSNRFVLGTAVLLAIVIPELIHPLVASWGRLFLADSPGVEISLIGATVALISAHLSLRRMGILPLVSARSLILPTFIVSFAVVIVVVYAARLPRASYHYWTASAIGFAWYHAVATMRVRLLKPVIGLIGLPEQLAVDLPENIRWEILSKPELRHDVAAVVIDPHASLEMEWSLFITGLVLEGVPVYHRADIEEGLTGRVSFKSHADNNFGALLPSLTYLRIKRLLDLLALPVAALLALPVLLAAAIAIKLDSPGPVLFRQVRMGHRGRPFVCYKLRTMRDGIGGPDFTRDDDDRVTRTGRFLRKWRIDELPQMLNILKGEMSWIGPRPEALGLALAYAADVRFYDYRHAVRPGISGWAAVHQGNVAEADAARLKLEYDFYYIKYFSIWLDFLIVLKTMQTVSSGFGSR